MRLPGEKLIELRQLLLDKTKQGRLADWTERIGDYARQICSFPLDSINWNSSPEQVAYEVILECERRNRVEQLEELLR